MYHHRCYNTETASQGHAIQDNVQFVTGNDFKQHISRRSTWIYPAEAGTAVMGCWVDASDSVCCVVIATIHRDAPPPANDALTPGYSF